MIDLFDNWRKALRGEKQPIYEDVAWLGYFAVQDRSPEATPAKGGRWPLIACAIFEKDGAVMAERAGKSVPVDWVWPYAATRPITYEAYQYWHTHGKFPEKETA